MGEDRRERLRMVVEQLEARGIKDPEVLEAFRQLPRHLFVPAGARAAAYCDRPVATYGGQTISQPYIVALMTELLLLPKEPVKILEIGTGSGYQAAILAYLGHHVISLERIPELIAFAKANLATVEFSGDIRVVQGDGSIGYSQGAPYDRIIVTAAAPHIPEALLDQLAVGGRLVIPCGSRYSQELICVDRISETETRQTRSIPCCFVPLIGQDGFKTW